MDATIRAYHASIAFVDRQIGRFLDTIKKTREVVRPISPPVTTVGTLEKKALVQGSDLGTDNACTLHRQWAGY